MQHTKGKNVYGQGRNGYGENIRRIGTQRRFYVQRDHARSEISKTVSRNNPKDQDRKDRISGGAEKH